MRLYYSKGACSLAVRITLHEMSVDCEYEHVDLKTKKTASGEDYLKINPKGSVPALELDSGEILTENQVLQQYLADKYQATTLLPPIADLKRYRVLEWLGFITTELHKTVSPLFNPQFSDELKNEMKAIFKKKLMFVENHLKGNQYLVDGQFTIADSYMYVILLWLKHFNIDILDWQGLSRYFSELNSRKSIKLALEEERLVN